MGLEASAAANCIGASFPARTNGIELPHFGGGHVFCTNLVFGKKNRLGSMSLTLLGAILNAQGLPREE